MCSSDLTSKLFADSTAIYDNMQFIADGLLYQDNKAFYETLYIGLPVGTRVSGDLTENVSFVDQLSAKRSGVFTDLAIKNYQNVRQNASQVNEFFYNTSNNVTSKGNYNNPYGKRWFQLAPYYNSSLHVVDAPGDYDKIRVGSQYPGIRVSGEIGRAHV